MFVQGRAGHRPEGHLLQDSLRADADAVAGIQPAGGQRQPRLLGPAGHGAALLHVLHLWTVQGVYVTVCTVLLLHCVLAGVKLFRSL